MNNLEERLESLFDDLGRAAPHDPDLAQTIRRQSRRRNMMIGAPIAAAVAVLLVVAVAAGYGRSGPVRPAAPASATTSFGRA